MRDALNRPLEKGDIFVRVGNYDTCLGVTTQITETSIKGVMIRMFRSPTPEESKIRYGGSLEQLNAYYNTRYELKFGTVSCKKLKRVVKLNALSLDEIEAPDIKAIFGAAPPETKLKASENYRKCIAYCVEQAKAGKPIKIPKEYRYIEKCTQTP